MCYTIIRKREENLKKEKEIKNMKKIYEITISFCGEESTITMINPNRKFLKVGNTEYSGAKIIKVERIK